MNYKKKSLYLILALKLNNEQNVEVSDTTGDQKRYTARAKKKFN